MRRSVIAVTAACIAGAIAAPALADPAADPPQVVQIVIHVSPSDLADAQSVAALYQRVTDAAASVCTEVAGDTSPNLVSHYSSRSQCQQELVRDALQNTRLEPLARYYAQTQDQGHRSTELASR